MSQLIVPFHATRPTNPVTVDGVRHVTPQVSLFGYQYSVPGWDAVQNLSYDAAVGPHDWTIRWQYQVPNNFYGIVTLAQAMVDISASGGQLNARVDVIHSDGTLGCTPVWVGSRADQPVSVSVAPQVILRPGDYLRGSTRNRDTVSRILIVTAQIVRVQLF
jgi:hypothetical protein